MYTWRELWELYMLTAGPPTSNLQPRYNICPTNEIDTIVPVIKQRGVSYAQASQDLSVHQSQLRSWVKMFADDPQHAFPGQGQMKPEQLEIARLKREVTKLKAERDILKKAAAYFAKEST
jgi:transposase